eukprot:296467_1
MSTFHQTHVRCDIPDSIDDITEDEITNEMFYMSQIQISMHETKIQQQKEKIKLLYNENLHLKQTSLVHENTIQLQASQLRHYKSLVTWLFEMNHSLQNQNNSMETIINELGINQIEIKKDKHELEGD